MTLVEIEAVIGAPLPASAQRRTYQVNTRHDVWVTRQARTWRRAALKLAGLRHGVRVETVTFAGLPPVS